MKRLCIVDPLISSNLSALVEINETRLIIEQKTLRFYLLKDSMHDLSKKELQTFKRIILEAYKREKGKNYFYECMLFMIEQQSKK